MLLESHYYLPYNKIVSRKNLSDELIVDISTQIKNNIRWHTIRGAIDLRELTEYLSELYKSLNFDPDMNVFWDLREADFTSVSPEFVFSFRHFVGQHWGKTGRSKAAIVVSSESGYEMSRKYEALMTSEYPSKVSIFWDRDFDKAKEWVELK